jgi:hypothetical protein
MANRQKKKLPLTESSLTYIYLLLLLPSQEERAKIFLKKIKKIKNKIKSPQRRSIFLLLSTNYI